MQYADLVAIVAATAATVALVAATAVDAPVAAAVAAGVDAAPVAASPVATGMTYRLCCQRSFKDCSHGNILRMLVVSLSRLNDSNWWRQIPHNLGKGRGLVTKDCCANTVGRCCDCFRKRRLERLSSMKHIYKRRPCSILGANIPCNPVYSVHMLCKEYHIIIVKYRDNIRLSLLIPKTRLRYQPP
jgi:hypothetical protein